MATKEKEKTIGEVATIASDYLRALVGERSITNVMVEEVEKKDKFWLITLGYDIPAALIGLGTRRDYKSFNINRKTGEVLKMKIRKVN